MSTWARFWPIDLHVHTPGSSDAKPENFGSPEEIVQAAIDTGLAAIAITDHNTAEWCDRIGDAAKNTSLIVLPGVEISTAEGHLLAIWEEGTSSTIIEELLVTVGIKKADRGRLDISAKKGLAEVAQEVAACGGVAVAAHADKEKGLLGLTVKSHLTETLMNEALSAVEVVQLNKVGEIAKMVGNKRILACVRGSDTWDSSTNTHALSGIGARRTWLKASRPDLVGLRHGLADPELRIRLDEPSTNPPYARLDEIQISGGFLDGLKVRFSADLNCLLGGTGAGKSLILEAIRYAMDQQLDRKKFPKLWEEVQSRLNTALTESGVVRLHSYAKGNFYRIERAFSKDGSAQPTVFQQISNDWVEVDLIPEDLFVLAAFSQGEILEYSREQVGRMTLVDSGIDLSKFESEIKMTTELLNKNALELIECRKKIRKLRNEAGQEAELKEQVRTLAGLFDTELVKEQAGWQKERSRLRKSIGDISNLSTPVFKINKLTPLADIKTNLDLFELANKIFEELDKSLNSVSKVAETAIEKAKTELSGINKEWDRRFEETKKKLDAELERVNPGSSLTTLRDHLATLQSKLAEAEASKEELGKEAMPQLQAVQLQREELITRLTEARHERREIRRSRVEALNIKTAGFVKLDIPSYGDFIDFRTALEKLKVGSRVNESVLDEISRTVHPLRFARVLWDQKINELTNEENGIDAASIGRLLGNIDERDLWEELFKIQVLDRPDILTVKFRKPEDQTYVQIEQLAHGQRCTAILVILLADGDTPVLVDQPEDALHAPWIEEYLVDRLRSLRGSRQYIFATRSPGIVVSGDAEQIVTMKATAGHGEIEASGSLERHDLNRLTLHHLEGGPVPFKRRTRKLGASTD